MKKLPIYVALDVDNEAQALNIAKTLAPYVEGFKVGPRLYFRKSPSLIPQLKSYGKVFLDFKFFDIPSTMLSAVEAGFELGADKVTVHAQAGLESLTKLAKLEARLNAKRDFKILAVTLLTSFSKNSLPFLARAFSIPSHVESLSDMVLKAGLRGLVCSGHELKFLRKRHPKAYLVSPGIRFESALKRNTIGGEFTGVASDTSDMSDKALSKKDSTQIKVGQKPNRIYAEDQKRVFTPKQALLAGANALVIGRPLYESSDPQGLCKKLSLSLTNIL